MHMFSFAWSSITCNKRHTESERSFLFLIQYICIFLFIFWFIYLHHIECLTISCKAGDTCKIMQCTWIPMWSGASICLYKALQSQGREGEKREGVHLHMHLHTSIPLHRCIALLGWIFCFFYFVSAELATSKICFAVDTVHGASNHQRATFADPCQGVI